MMAQRGRNGALAGPAVAAGLWALDGARARGGRGCVWVRRRRARGRGSRVAREMVRRAWVRALDVPGVRASAARRDADRSSAMRCGSGLVCVRRWCRCSVSAAWARLGGRSAAGLVQRGSVPLGVLEGRARSTGVVRVRAVVRGGRAWEMELWALRSACASRRAARACAGEGVLRVAQWVARVRA